VLNAITSTVSGDAVTLVVNRRRVMKSAELAISKADFSFTRPVKVIFSGEDAVDDGGPKREFFR